jgi:hypothetical protein
VLLNLGAAQRDPFVSRVCRAVADTPWAHRVNRSLRRAGPTFAHQRCGITRWWNLRLAQGGSVVACNRVAVGVVAFIGKLQAGSLNDSPLVSTAQAMRAFFAAMATTAFQ